MKKLILNLALLFLAAVSFGQSGLDGIVIEKYYVSDATDAAGSIGALPVGSVTWRIYADLAAGYTLQAVYGVDVAPAGPSTGDHNLLINTTSTFFNNEDYGSTTPNGINVTNTRKNSVMLDTWFSMSGNAAGKVGVIKADDGDGALLNSTVPIMLQNNDPCAAPPINAVDGMINGAPPTVTFVGFSAPELAVFDNVSQVGSSINTSNASVAVLGGVSGAVGNRVLIGQFTTTGVFHYELNLQLGTPSAGVEKWVASNPIAGEFTMASLTGTVGAPNTPPAVSITSPSTSTQVVPYTFSATVTATDADGINMVELLDNGVPIDTITGSGPYNFPPVTYNTASPNSHVLTARATDNNSCGAVATSSPVTITLGANSPPSISITSPANGTPFVAPAVVSITTNAMDSDGSISQVEFFVSGVGSVGIDNVGPTFSFNWTSGAPFGSRQITAVATDNNNATTTSAVVTITVSDPNALAYGIETTSNTCVPATFCVPVEARDTVDNVIGYDVVMHFDATKVTPTGVITVDNDLVNPNYVDVINSIDWPNSNIFISLSFNGSAPLGTEFNGIGNIFCVEFAKLAAFTAVDTAEFSIVSLQESYFTGVIFVPADPGDYSTFRDTSYGGHLEFWFNSSPIRYNSGNPSQYLITNIYGTDNVCGNQSLTAVQPDLNGDFVYNTSNGPRISIQKDIAGLTSVQPVINGFDAFLTKRVLINDAGFLPSAYQIIAMDANLDGVISSGDLSQINQRTVAILPEFKQYWNYDAAGNPILGAGSSKDWIFIDAARLNNNPPYQISLTYPLDDNAGYSRYSVPQTPFCLPLATSSADTSGNCQILVTETYKGVLVGDVNGNFATVVPSNLFRANGTNKVIFDLTKAVKGNGYVDVPVSVLSTDAVNALDFAMKFNASKLSFNSVNSNVDYIESVSNLNTADNTLRFTSYSLQNYELGKAVANVRFNTTEQITKEDLNSLEGYLNGDRVGVDVNDGSVDYMVNVFPNPATEMLNVVVSEDAVVHLMSIDGSKVFAFGNVSANQKMQINTSDIASGIYMLKVSNGNFVSVKKVVVQK